VIAIVITDKNVLSLARRPLPFSLTYRGNLCLVWKGRLGHGLARQRGKRLLRWRDCSRVGVLREFSPWCGLWIWINIGSDVDIAVWCGYGCLSVWMGRVLGIPIVERVSSVDTSPETENGLRYCFWGEDDDVKWRWKELWDMWDLRTLGQFCGDALSFKSHDYEWTCGGELWVWT